MKILIHYHYEFVPSSRDCSLMLQMHSESILSDLSQKFKNPTHTDYVLKESRMFRTRAFLTYDSRCKEIDVLTELARLVTTCVNYSDYDILANMKTPAQALANTLSGLLDPSLVSLKWEDAVYVDFPETGIKELAQRMLACELAGNDLEILSILPINYQVKQSFLHKLWECVFKKGELV